MRKANRGASAADFTPARSAWLMTTTWRGAPRILLRPDDGGGQGGAGAGGTGAAGGGATAGAAGGDGGAGAAGAGGQQGGSTGSLSGQNGGQASGQQGGGAAPYYPDGLPEHLRGANERETLDKVFKAFDGFNRANSERGSVPKTPDEYKIEASDKLKPFVANFDKDPVYKATREIFHKAGLTDKQFNKVVGPWMEHLIDEGMIAPPMDAAAAMESLVPPEAKNLDDNGRKAAVEARIKTNTAWIDGAKAQKTMPDEVADFLGKAVLDDPSANKAVEWLRGAYRQQGPAMDGGNGAGTSEADIKARMTDPRNDPNKPQFDRAYAAETDRLSQQAFGN